jgi:hypothetical protein
LLGTVKKVALPSSGKGRRAYPRPATNLRPRRRCSSTPAQHLIGARRLVDELYRATDGQLRQMRSLQLIAERARADAKAVYHAVEARWVEVSPENDPHSIVLTDAGRRLAA